MFQAAFKYDSCMMESDSNRDLFRRQRLLSNVTFKCVPARPPAHPSEPLPRSSQTPKPLIPLSFGMQLICRPGSSQRPEPLCESHISLCSNESQRHRFPAVLGSVIYHRRTKSSCWTLFLYARHRAVFTCRAASFNSLFPSKHVSPGSPGKQ